MSQSIISYLTGNSPLKIVDEFTGSKRWPQLKTKSVRITLVSEVTDMPFQGEGFIVEPQSIANLRDNLRTSKVVNPSRIDAEFMCDDISVLTSLENVFNDTSHTLKVYSKEVVASNMAITDMKIDQKPDALSAVYLAITFQQTAPDTYNGFNPEREGDRNSYGINVQGVDAVSFDIGSVYNRVSNYLGSLV